MIAHILRTWSQPSLFLAYVPGLALSALIALVALTVGAWLGNAIIWALLIGMTLAALVRIPDVVLPGIGTSASLVLRAGVALLGFQVTGDAFVALGASGSMLLMVAVFGVIAAGAVVGAGYRARSQCFDRAGCCRCHLRRVGCSGICSGAAVVAGGAQARSRLRDRGDQPVFHGRDGGVSGCDELAWLQRCGCGLCARWFDPRSGACRGRRIRNERGGGRVRNRHQDAAGCLAGAGVDAGGWVRGERARADRSSQTAAVS